jgi:hypothetical protein
MARPPPIKTYLPAWQCIYCGTKDRGELGQEHIIPLSLNGMLIFPRSSCRDCAAITGRIEQKCAREMWLSYRRATGSYSRPRTGRIEMLPIIKVTEGREEIIQIPADDYPFINIVLPDFDIPNVLRTDEWKPHYVAKFVSLVGTRQMKNPSETFRQMFKEPTEFRMPNPPKFSVDDFVRLLAKVAHSFAVAELGYDNYNWFLPPLILNQHRNLYDYVGGALPLDPNLPSCRNVGDIGVESLYEEVHTISYETIVAPSGLYFISVLFQLFNKYMPKYRILVAQYHNH